MKLVTAACALVAGLALADGIESANVVGYQDKALPAGESTWTCPTFTPIGGCALSFTLGDIVPNENFAPFEDTIQFATASGAWEDQLTYVSAAFLEENEIDGIDVGWYGYADEELTTNLNATEVPFAKGFCAQSGYDNVALRYCGEVPQSATPVALGAGESTWMGNASVENLTLGDIVPNENFAPFEDTIQFATASGAWEDQLTYVSAAFLEENEIDGVDVGWYGYADEELTTNLNATPVAAGKAFCAQTGYENVTISIPSPL